MKNGLNLILITVTLISLVVGCADSNSNVSPSKPVSFANYTTTASPVPSLTPNPNPRAKNRKKKTTKNAANTETLSNFSESTDSKTSYTAPKSSNGYHLGPRGGCYVFTSGGNKRYVDRSLCY